MGRSWPQGEISESDIERGFRVESVTTNAALSYEMPQGATEYERWRLRGGSARFVGGNTGERVRVASDVPGQLVTLRAQVADCRSRPVEISAYVVDPLSVKLTAWIVGDNDGSYYATDAQSVSNMVAGMNKIYEQIGVSFYIDSICYTNVEKLLDISKDNGEKRDLDKRRKLVNIAHDTGGFELYFINRIAKKIRADCDLYGIVVSTNCSARTLAHEIGHSLGCADVLDRARRSAPALLPEPFVSQIHVPQDWSNGTGCRYYATDIRQADLLHRLLMYRYGRLDSIDMTSGSIYGYAADGEAGLVDVGFFRGGARRAPRLHK